MEHSAIGPDSAESGTSEVDRNGMADHVVAECDVGTLARTVFVGQQTRRVSGSMYSLLGMVQTAEILQEVAAG